MVFFAGPKGETHEWFIHDGKVDKTAHKMMSPDTVLFGRKTFELFESYWPGVAKDNKAPKEMKEIADELNEMTKIVVSKKLKKVTWQNSYLVKGDLATEIKKIKQGKGKDIVIFGSGTIVEQLTTEKLIDEYLLVVTPVILGSGRSMFTDVKKLGLELIEARDFKSGNVMLHYKKGKK